LSRDIVERLAAFERKVSRRMFVGIEVNESWTRRYVVQLISDVSTEEERQLG
jgi:hypothetical protein